MDFSQYTLPANGLGISGFIQERYAGAVGPIGLQANLGTLGAVNQAALQESWASILGNVRAVDALCKSVGETFADAIKPFQQLQGIGGPLSTLSDITAAAHAAAYPVETWAEAITGSMETFDPPVVPIPLELPSDEDADYVRALEDRVRALEARDESWALKYEASERACDALRRQLHDMKMQRRAYLLDATDEHKPDPPVIDSQFPDN